MKRCTAQHGFSLVELMVALVSGSILAVTAGSMMYYTYLGWQRSNRAVGIQRDAAMAAELLSHSLRRTAAVNVTVTSATITIVRPVATERFSVSGQDLVYDPDTSTPGADEIHVAFDDVEQLGELVKARVAKELPERSHQLALGREDLCPYDLLGIRDQRAELVHCEGLLVEAEACPLVEDRQPVAQQDHQDQEQEQRQRDEDEGCRQRDVEDTVDDHRRKLVAAAERACMRKAVLPAVFHDCLLPSPSGNRTPVCNAIPRGGEASLRGASCGMS